MHLNRIGKNLKPNARFKTKVYLISNMKTYLILLNKYGNKINSLI